MIKLLKINLFVFVLFAFSFSACKSSNDDDQSDPAPTPPAAFEPDLLIGADLSFYPQLNTLGYQYFDENGLEIEMLSYLKSKGFELIRLRLWHSPGDAHSNLREVIDFSKQIKAQNMDILLDFHFSDSWADPGKQAVPAAWQGLDYNVIKDSVYQYTLQVMQLMKDQNTLPAIVQVGNETNSGFLWPYGKIEGNSAESWQAYAGLVKESVKAIREIAGSDSEIMMHFAGVDAAPWFFNGLKEQQVDYDWVGLSWYPIWHTQDLTAMQNTLSQLIAATGKNLMIVETAYPFTLDWDDDQNNLCGLPEQLVEGYPATEKGQADIVSKLLDMLEELSSENTECGICYWAPEWVSREGGIGSSWENMCLFDFDHRALPVINEFDRNKAKEGEK